MIHTVFKSIHNPVITHFLCALELFANKAVHINEVGAFVSVTSQIEFLEACLVVWILPVHLDNDIVLSFLESLWPF